MKPFKDAKDADVATHEAVHATAVAALAALHSAEVPAASVAPADVPAEARGGGSGRRVAPRQNHAAMAGVGGAHDDSRKPILVGGTMRARCAHDALRSRLGGGLKGNGLHHFW